MILWADVVIHNSTVEYYKQKASAKLYAKRIEKKKEVEALEVDARLTLPPYQDLFIKAEKLLFDPETFNCQASQHVDLKWGDLHVDAVGLTFQLQNYKLFSQEISKARYRQWTFEVPEFVYEHEKKTLTCALGCTIFDDASRLKASYAIAYLDRRFDLSKSVLFQNKDVEIATRTMHCLLNQANEIEKIDAPYKLKIRTRDGKVALQGDRMIYQNDKITLSGHVQGAIEKELPPMTLPAFAYS